jgi:hypothetical protein
MRTTFAMKNENDREREKGAKKRSARHTSRYQETKFEGKKGIR